VSLVDQRWLSAGPRRLAFTPEFKAEIVELLMIRSAPVIAHRQQ
jgi:hypothetical protein